MSAVEVVDDVAVIDILTDIWNQAGELTAELVVAAAANQDSPLHSRFEWDDGAAANEYRKDQARLLIRSITIHIEDNPVRAFPFVVSQGSYTPIRDVMAQKDWREELVAQFERDARMFEARWKNHRHLAEHYRNWLQKQAVA